MNDQLNIRYIRTKTKIRKVVTYINDDCELRKQHQEILEYLRKNTYNSIFAKAYIPYRGIYENAKAHMYNDVFLKLDIKNFFNSIDHEKLTLQLYREIKHAKIIKPDMEKCREIVEVCSCGEKGLPLGLVTSPDLANLYLKKFDGLLYGKLKNYPIKNVIYTRYADDIVISFKYDPDYELLCGLIRADVIDYLEEYSLVLNEKKTEIVNLMETNHVHITGVSVTKGAENYRRISVGKKLKNKIFWDAINIFDTPEDQRKSEDVKHLKGMMSFILSIEKEGISFTYSRNMRQLVYDRGFKNLPQLVAAL